MIRLLLLFSTKSINCGIKRRNDLNDVKQLAISKGGISLSTDYTNNYTKMSWQCNKNHVWMASYNQIQSGDWCPNCANLVRNKNRILSIEIYKQVAISNGGECLSDIVKNSHDKLEWQCSEGHIWFAKAFQIKNTKQWCPQCAKDNKRK